MNRWRFLFLMVYVLDNHNEDVVSAVYFTKRNVYIFYHFRLLALFTFITNGKSLKLEANEKTKRDVLVLGF